jgi:hypothetical protein
VLALNAPFLMLTLTAISSKPMMGVGCDISVDGETLVQQARQITGFTNCMKTYTPPKS